MAEGPIGQIVWLESLRSSEQVKNWNIDKYLKSGSFSEFYSVSRKSEQGVLKIVSSFCLCLRFLYFNFKFLSIFL